VWTELGLEELRVQLAERCSALEGDDANRSAIGFLPNAACPVPTMQAHGGQVLQMQ